jgi:YjbE family integral membrane protein
MISPSIAGFSSEFLVALVSIVLIDIVLAGDNSIVIAMAVRGLPQKMRFRGILLGSLGAVVLRVIFTAFVAQLLGVQLVKLVGGALIFWIAIKLMKHESPREGKVAGAATVWQAVWVILVADVTMSLDNILAVAGASHGNIKLLLFGFGLSIPLVVFASSFISKLMDRFPIIIWLGVAVLGKVGAEMVISDPLVVGAILSPLNLTELKNGVAHPQHLLLWLCEAAGAFGVIGAALIQKRKSGPGGHRNGGLHGAPQS